MIPLSRWFSAPVPESAAATAGPLAAPAGVSGRRVVWDAAGFGFDPAEGTWFTGNRTALEILGWLREGADREAVFTRLARRYAVPAALLRRDLDRFFDQLEAFGLVEENRQVLP